MVVRVGVEPTHIRLKVLWLKPTCRTHHLVSFMILFTVITVIFVVFIWNSIIYGTFYRSGGKNDPEFITKYHLWQFVMNSTVIFGAETSFFALPEVFETSILPKWQSGSSPRSLRECMWQSPLDSRLSDITDSCALPKKTMCRPRGIRTPSSERQSEMLAITPRNRYIYYKILPIIIFNKAVCMGFEPIWGISTNLSDSQASTPSRPTDQKFQHVKEQYLKKKPGFFTSRVFLF